MAASIGVAEVFKRIFGVPHDVAPPAGKTEFSLFEHSTNPTWIGPALPSEIHLPDTLLVGAGAIGNALALLLSQLPVTGRLHIIDKQAYAEENLGTCILLDRIGWLGQAKAEQLASWLREKSKLFVTAEKSYVQTSEFRKLHPELEIDLVLNGLDDVEARHYVQGLWPSIIVDGGINEVGAAVTQHRFDQNDFACLKCWFEMPKIDAYQLQSRVTGLNRSSLQDISRLITEDDIRQAEKDKQEWLREQASAKKTICSVITEAMLAASLGVDVEDNFKPSVPFVATASAALVMAETLKALLFPTHPVKSMFQFANLFWGVEHAISLNRNPTPSCQCIVHRNAIAKLRARRKISNNEIAIAMKGES